MLLVRKSKITLTLLPENLGEILIKKFNLSADTHINFDIVPEGEAWNEMVRFVVNKIVMSNVVHEPDGKKVSTEKGYDVQRIETLLKEKFKLPVHAVLSFDIYEKTTADGTDFYNKVDKIYLTYDFSETINED